MGRKTLDRLLAAGGLVVAAVLLIASALLYWAHSFVDHEVHTQLAAQKIYFPAKGSESLADPQIKPYLEKYAGKQLVNGDAYAFGKMGEIAFWAAGVALLGAIVMTVLSALGFAHARGALDPPPASSEPDRTPLVVA